MDVAENEAVDFECYKIFAMYADGVPVADIALAMGWGSPGPVYDRLNLFPKTYDEAKKQLAKKRNAKYRRIGALASDIQLQTLDRHLTLLNNESAWQEQFEIQQRQWDTEGMEVMYRHLYDEDEQDVEGKVTRAAMDIPDDLKARVLETKRTMEKLQKLIKSAEMVRADIRHISAVGDTAERRADLNEGKATERIQEIGREPTKEEWEEYWGKQKDAGNGLDTESITA